MKHYYLERILFIKSNNNWKILYYIFFYTLYIKWQEKEEEEEL